MPVLNATVRDFNVFKTSWQGPSYSQLGQDVWVIFQLGRKANGYFVEIGAGDGVINSNTCMLERKFNWQGVLVEPRRSAIPSLLANRPLSVKMGYCVIGNKAWPPGQEHSVPFTEMQWGDLSVQEGYGQDHMALHRQPLDTYPVYAYTLDEILHYAQAPKQIDYMSIDTEGSEYDILAAFDFSRYDIQLLTVEHNFTENRAKTRALLEANGYFCVDWPEVTAFDDWFIKER